MSSPNSTPQRRILRTSNPTPPDREEKRSRRDMLDQSNDDVNSITAETLQIIIPHQFKISAKIYKTLQMQYRPIS